MTFRREGYRESKLNDQGFYHGEVETFGGNRMKNQSLAVGFTLWRCSPDEGRSVEANGDKSLAACGEVEPKDHRGLPRQNRRLLVELRMPKADCEVEATASAILGVPVRLSFCLVSCLALLSTAPAFAQAPPAANPFQRFFGEWTLKDDAWSQNWGGGCRSEISASRSLAWLTFMRRNSPRKRHQSSARWMAPG